MGPRQIRVDVPGEAYDVVIGEGLLAETGALLRRVSSAKRAALVADESVSALYGDGVRRSLSDAGFDVAVMTVPPGESTKSWDTAGRLTEELAAAGLGREDVVIALGGGVVGDLAGFAAAVYLRGIAFAQVPTTLLAMVDSSVGGKTAVDLSAGKNLAGAFKQPRVVVADTAALATLPEGEWLSGLAEAAKTAVLDGDEFMGWMEANASAILARDAEVVGELVARCVGFKAGVVARDEKEEGPRECLNYGHTLGHAIEKVAGYGTYTHGAAVAEGMRFAVDLAVDLADAAPEFSQRQERMLRALSLDGVDARMQPGELLGAMHSDKKARGGRVRMVLASAPGEWSCEAVSDELVLGHLERWAATKGGEGR